jgi:hypothetical protein
MPRLAKRTVKQTAYFAAHGLLIIALANLSPDAALAQRIQVILDDPKAIVTQIELSTGEGYTLPKDQAGSVWIALDPVILKTAKVGLQNNKSIRAGDAGTISSGDELEFRVDGEPRARLVIVRPKTTHQELTVEPVVLGSLEDGSGRNATLFVAVSDCHFRDIRNLGDESEWIPGKPAIIVMKAGNTRWIRPGIHHFENLGPTESKLVSIEW